MPNNARPHAYLTITVEGSSDAGDPYQTLYEHHENFYGAYNDDILRDIESRIDDASNFIRQLTELAKAEINAREESD